MVVAVSDDVGQTASIRLASRAVEGALPAVAFLEWRVEHAQTGAGDGIPLRRRLGIDRLPVLIDIDGLLEILVRRPHLRPTCQTGTDDARRDLRRQH